VLSNSSGSKRLLLPPVAKCSHYKTPKSPFQKKSLQNPLSKKRKTMDCCLVGSVVAQRGGRREQEQMWSTGAGTLNPFHLCKRRKVVRRLLLLFTVCLQQRLAPGFLVKLRACLVWMLKLNKYCSNFILFDKKFPILD
jgi:hypothetical protein